MALPRGRLWSLLPVISAIPGAILFLFALLSFLAPTPNRFLATATSGGLNQQRTGIVDAVVAARILNATLVVPKLDQKSFWKDASVFDVYWFIPFPLKDVKIIKQLPRMGGKSWTPHTVRFPRKCSGTCYKNRVLPVLLKRHAIQLTKFDYRLANKLDTDMQKLRCRVNHHALRFTDPIFQLGKMLVNRMRLRSKHYIALHLRFEPDMLAFLGCDYGGGEKERTELGAIRRRWKTLHKTNPDRQRRQRRCPITPEEVGLMLRALGYGSDVHIYVESGEVMAALDFIVCDESDVFVTNNNGNMAKILAGRRRYFGHKPTIRPNAKKLYPLFSNRSNMTWESFASKVRTYQKGFMGKHNEVRPDRGEFHENPSACICEDSEAKNNARHRKLGKGDDATEKDVMKSDDQNDDNDGDNDVNDDNTDETEWIDPDNDEYRFGSQEKGLYNGTGLDNDMVTSDEPELEEILSD